MQAHVHSFFDAPTSTFSHVVHAGPGTPCAIIDPVLGYESKSGLAPPMRSSVTYSTCASPCTGCWKPTCMPTTSPPPPICAQAGGRIAASEAVQHVRKVFLGLYNLPENYCQAHVQFDHLFRADEAFAIGELQARALHVPGHTPADLAFRVGDDVVFVGDTLFAPEVGTARCDFPGGSAVQLFRSIRRLLDLPEDTRLFLCHDYPPSERAPCALCTVAEQRAANIHMRDGGGEADFIVMRSQRDAQLELPALLLRCRRSR